MSELLAAGADALREARWSDAHEAFAAAADASAEPIGDALFGLADAKWWLGDLAGSVANREHAFNAFSDAGDAFNAAYTAIVLSFDHHKQFGNVLAAAGWLHHATRLIEDHALDGLRGWVLFARSLIASDAHEAERLARDAHAFGRESDDRDLELCALSQVGVALVGQGRVQEGVRCLDEAMTVSLATNPSPDTVVFASCMMMTSCTACAEFARAVRWVQATIAFTERYGCPFLYAECRILYGAVLLATGEWEQAERELVAGLELARGAVPQLHRLAVGTLAELWLAQGRLDDAERLVDGYDDHAETALALARIHLARGRAAAAAAVARRRIDALGERRLEIAPLVEVLGEAEVASGDAAIARDRAIDLIAFGTEFDCEPVRARGDRSAGRAMAAIGDVDAARRHLDRALVGFGRLEMRYDAALTRALLAEALCETEPDVSIAEARAALAAFEQLGANTDADRMAALLRSLGTPAARLGGRGGVGLTKREQQVFALLGEGLSNPEIAARLHLSRKTVEHHVAHVLSKLGLRSRAEAAAEAIRRK